MVKGGGVVLTEEVNITKCLYLLETFSLNDFLQIYDGKKNEAEKYYNEIIKCLHTKATTNLNTCIYTYGKGKSYGRLYCGKSIQTFPKYIRGFICDGLTTDVDMTNCHYKILENLCRENNFEAVQIKHYCDNREECLKRVMEDDKLDRIQAKKKFLTVLNSQKYQVSNNDFIKNLDKEIKKIQKQFQSLDKYKFIEANNKKGNYDGSFINNVCSYHENIILNAMIEIIHNNELEVHSLMFDGLMIYGDHYDDKELLPFIEKELFNKFGWDIPLDFKRHETHFELPDDYIPKPNLLGYNQLKNEFEKKNCKVDCKFVYEAENGEIIHYNKTDFQTKYEPLEYIQDGKKKSFIKQWFKDSDARVYERFDVYPDENQCPNNVYNLWKTFTSKKHKYTEGSEEVREKGLEYFKNHISVMCNHDEDVINKVNMWIAQMLQYPQVKSYELVFISDEGAGKGMFLEFLKNIMGNNKVWECTDPQNQIFHRFNSMLQHSFLVCINEANKSNFFNANDKKKALITDPQITIKCEGVKPFLLVSVHRFIVFSNNADPIPANKRRSGIIRMSDEKIGNMEYFDDGFKYAENPDVCKAIYDYYMSYQTKRKLRVDDIPITEYSNMLAEIKRKPIDEFLEDIASQDFGDKEKKTYIRENFYSLFMEYCKDNHILCEKSKTAFGIELSSNYKNKFIEIPKDLKYFKNIKDKKRVYIIDVKLIKEHYKIDDKPSEEIEISDSDSD